jgi:hypothetical protein
MLGPWIRGVFYGLWKEFELKRKPSYRDEMVSRFWSYQKKTFRGRNEIFERPDMSDGRPPVFHKHADAFNVLMDSDISPKDRGLLLDEIPVRERHRLFRSMSSSQAIALSVFGNLKLYGFLGLLNELHDEEGHPIFGEEAITPENFRMEYKVDSLGEPRPTSLDALIIGKHPVAIECKLMESEVGSCSRPHLTQRDSNYERDFCDGNYIVQGGRASRCSLTEIGVEYWDHVPRVFMWKSDMNLVPCPLRANYQLVRNLLAVSVPSKAMPSGGGHVVLVYDERNPAFQIGGKGYAAYEETRNALHEPDRLKRCSWQQIARLVRREKRLAWLSVQLETKYGI